MRVSRESVLNDGRFKLLVAICIGAFAGAFCRAWLTSFGEMRGAGDFTSYWLGARAVIDGKSPYDVVTAGGQYGLPDPFLYPLMAAIAVVPFALWLEPISAASAFVGLGTALFVWGLLKSGYGRLWTLASVPFLWVCRSGQWAPLIAASALLPALAWLAPAKPNLGLATIAYRPSKVAILGSAGFVALAFLVNPRWLMEWLDALAIRSADYRMPVTVAPGFLIVLAALRWRRPEARLLLVMGFMPQLFLFYDQLLLWIVPKTWRETAALSALSFFAIEFARIGYVSSDLRNLANAYAPVIVLTLYLPCLIMVLRRPNEGETPAWIGALVARIPSRLRGHGKQERA